VFGVSFDTARYWHRKELDPTFRNGQHGGYRRGNVVCRDCLTCASLRDNTMVFVDHGGDVAAQALLYVIVCEHPEATLGQLLQLCQQQQLMAGVSLDWIQKTIADVWGWSWRDARIVSQNKFAPNNVQYWGEFASLVPEIDWRRLKFMDESHCVSKDLSRSKRCSPVGKTLRVFDEFPNETRLTLSVLTAVDKPRAPLFYSITADINDRWSFFTFVMDAIDAGYIGAGDILVVDNAPIHVANNMLTVLLDAMQAVGANFVRLPAYSPELNPCEFVFGLLKEKLRHNAFPDLALVDRLISGMRTVTIDNVLAFYRHCTGTAYRVLDGGD